MTEIERPKTVRITNIQRFCLHDGPGIRTIVFLKGCTLHCPWCCNPENMRFEKEVWHKTDGTSGIYGEDITLDELEKLVLKDNAFYLDGGGITFSGGEPLLQIEEYKPLLRDLRRKHINIALETSLFVERDKVEEAAPYFDFWYVDMKLMSSNVCQRLLGGDLAIYFSNLEWLIRSGVNPHIRIPCVHGITDTCENIAELIRKIKEFKLECIELLRIHDLALEKYRSLNRSFDVDVSKSAYAVMTVEAALKKNGIRPVVLQI